jgi:hypothetical protein
VLKQDLIGESTCMGSTFKLIRGALYLHAFDTNGRTFARTLGYSRYMGSAYWGKLRHDIGVSSFKGQSCNR